MKKYRAVVTTIKEYEIEIDETKMTEEELDGFEAVFHKLDEYDDRYKSMAHDYARLRSIFGESFIEGYGYVLQQGKVPGIAKLNGYEPDGSINLIEYDDDGYVDVDIEEID